MDHKVLYEDDHCLVIDKSAGVDVTKILDPLSCALSPKERRDLFLAHRLDKGTTGCLLIAKSQEDKDTLQAQFKDRSVKKVYRALVAGIPSPKEAIIDSPIGRSLTQKIKMSILNLKKGREAQTQYKVVESYDGYSLVECYPRTGRTHQIRVHLASIGHPILGDDTYGSKESRRVSTQLGIDAICLHAWKLSFDSPSGEHVEAEAPFPSFLAS
jgi:23S rRNA pseudouridine1911/1915/1917 synthase